MMASSSVSKPLPDSNCFRHSWTSSHALDFASSPRFATTARYAPAASCIRCRASRALDRVNRDSHNLRLYTCKAIILQQAFQDSVRAQPEYSRPPGRGRRFAGMTQKDRHRLCQERIIGRRRKDQRRKTCAGLQHMSDSLQRLGRRGEKHQSHSANRGIEWRQRPGQFIRSTFKRFDVLEDPPERRFGGHTPAWWPRYHWPPPCPLNPHASPPGYSGYRHRRRYPERASPAGYRPYRGAHPWPGRNSWRTRAPTSPTRAPPPPKCFEVRIEPSYCWPQFCLSRTPARSRRTENPAKPAASLGGEPAGYDVQPALGPAIG